MVKKINKPKGNKIPEKKDKIINSPKPVLEPEQKNLGGHPKVWELTEVLAKRICELVSTNTCSLEEICAKNADVPTAKIVKRWRIESDWFGAMYARAKQQQIELHVENATNFAYELIAESKDGAAHFNKAHVSAVQVFIDSIKWLSSKLAPKIYGTNPLQEEQQRAAMTVNFYPSNQKPKEEK